jgi:hypothetical protein
MLGQPLAARGGGACRLVGLGDAGEPAQLVEERASASPVLQEEAHERAPNAVSWVEANRKVWSLRDGEAREIIALEGIVGFAATADGLYVAERRLPNGKVCRVPWRQGSPATLANKEPLASVLGVVAGFVYWERQGERDLLRARAV